MINSIFIHQHKYFFWGLVILFWVVFINIFPSGYVFVGGDTPQFIEAHTGFYNLIYNDAGKASTFYSIFYILDTLKISDSVQLSFFLGIIIVGSYLSFYIFSGRIFEKVQPLYRTTASLFYALNLYTLSLFLGNWGYSYFPSLYIFIPILSGYLILFLQTGKYNYAALWGLTLFLGSSGFGNPAFFLSFIIFSFLLISLLLAMKIIPFSRSLISQSVILIIISFLANAYWLLPLFPAMKSGVEGIFESKVLEFDYIISSTASPIWNTISLIHYSQDYFPYNFPAKGMDVIKNFFIAISFLPAILISAGLFFKNKFQEKNKRIFLAFFVLIVIMIALIARAVQPFYLINYHLFNIWGINTLRGFDKTAIFFPFIMSALILIVYIELGNRKWVMASSLVILMIPLPFFTGKLQQNVGCRLSGGKNFKQSSMSFLVKVPDEYYGARDIINNDKEISSLATLPYSSADGSGISDYPKWKLYGLDITRYLYNKDFIEANGSYFPGWNFARSFNEDNNGNYEWIIELLGSMNSRYIIFHKDAPENYVAKSKTKLASLEGTAIDKLEENDYFILYKIKNEFFYPRIYWSNDEGMNKINSSNFSNIDLKNIDHSEASFQQSNPKKYIVAKNDAKLSKNIILSKPYDPNWKAEAELKNGKKIELRDHFNFHGIANGWRVGDNSDINKIYIEYYPTKIMKLGFFISFGVVLFLIFYLLKYYYYGHKNKIICDVF